MRGYDVRFRENNLQKYLLTGLDKGGADLIADGKIKVKSGVTLKKFTDKSLVLSDGSELPADVVVFA